MPGSAYQVAGATEEDPAEAVDAGDATMPSEFMACIRDGTSNVTGSTVGDIWRV